MQGREARGSELADRIAADRSSALAAFIFLMLGVVWLVIGSLAGPHRIAEAPHARLAGGLRTAHLWPHPRAHLNMVVYGWGINDRDGDRSVAPATGCCAPNWWGSSYAIAGGRVLELGACCSG